LPALCIAIAALTSACTASNAGVRTSTVPPTTTSSTTIPDPFALERADSRSRQAALDLELIEGLSRRDLLGLPRALGAWDKALVYERGCHSSWESPTVRPCALGAVTGPLVVVSGDSHAAQLQPMFSAWAKKRNWRFISITKSGCPIVTVKPVLAEESKLALRLPYPSCVKWQQAALARIEQLAPDVVVLPLLSRRGLTEPGGIKTWSREITATVSRLAATTRVVVLGDDPQVGIDIPKCLARTKDPARCAISIEKAVLPERLDAERTAASSGGGEWFDITSWFCAPAGCPATSGRFVTRRDDNHATASFAAHIWPRLDPVINPWGSDPGVPATG
jgi:hypothetical protein